MSTLSAQAQQGSRWSTLAYQSYSLVSGESFYDMWDVVTTCWLMHEDFFVPPQTMNLTIDAALDATQGCLKQTRGGRAVSVVLQFAPNGQSSFYDFVAEQFNR